MMTLRSLRPTRARLAALAVALALSFVSTAGHATTQVITAEMRAACTADAFRLCFSEIPNVERITACMRAKRASLTEQCRAVVNKYDGK